MIFYLLCSATSAAARNMPQESIRCLDGRRYLIQPINDTLLATETNECCSGYTLLDGSCRESPSSFSLDPLVLRRFVTAIGLLLMACLLVAVISMLIAYKMFYQRRGKADHSERVTLAEDLDCQSTTSTCAT